VEHSTPTPKGKGLLPAPESPVCRIRCKTFSAPLNKFFKGLPKKEKSKIRNLILIKLYLL
jgi:hypothetical protein